MKIKMRVFSRIVFIIGICVFSSMASNDTISMSVDFNSALGKKVIPVWCRQNVMRPWVAQPKYYNFMEEAELLSTIDVLTPDSTYQPVPMFIEDAAGIRVDSANPYPTFAAIDNIVNQGMIPGIDLGYTPYQLSQEFINSNSLIVSPSCLSVSGLDNIRNEVGFDSAGSRNAKYNSKTYCTIAYGTCAKLYPDSIEFDLAPKHPENAYEIDSILIWNVNSSNAPKSVSYSVLCNSSGKWWGPVGPDTLSNTNSSAQVIPIIIPGPSRGILKLRLIINSTYNGKSTFYLGKVRFMGRLIARAYGWAMGKPNNYNKYRQYDSAFFAYLEKKYSPAQLNTWNYQLLREPDNTEGGWDPNQQHTIANGDTVYNLPEYEKLYDYTMAGMRAAGINRILQPANMMMGNYSSNPPSTYQYGYFWIPKFAYWFFNKPITDGLPGQRIQQSTDTLILSFSGYAGFYPGPWPAQLGPNPEYLDTLVKVLRQNINSQIPSHPYKIENRENNFLYNMLTHRYDATELGAAHLAGIYRVALDPVVNINRIVSWGFGSAYNLSHWADFDYIPSAAFNTVSLFQKMENNDMVSVTLPQNNADHVSGIHNPSAEISALASKRNNASYVLVYDFTPAYDHSLPGENIKITLNGLKPNSKYRLTQYRIDSVHSTYTTQLYADIRYDTLSPAAQDTVHDGLMDYAVTAIGKGQTWNLNRPFYKQLSQLSTMGGQTIITTDARGGYVINNIAMPANSVSLFEIKPPDITPILNLLLGD